MNKPEAPKPVEPYVSMLALQEEYLQLSQEGEALEREISAMTGPEGEELLRKLVRLRRRIRRFERRARATGAVLDENADRVLAQSMLDFWSLRQAYLERLSSRLREHVGSERALPLLASAPRLRDPMRLVPFDEASAPQLPDEPSPFVGLNAFGADERDWAIFFGRDDAVAELKDMVAEQRLVIVTGPSGSGKSSLIMAGLLPKLRAGGLEGSADWIYWPPVLPGGDPLAALLQAVRPAGTEIPNWVSRRRAALEKSPESLVSIMADAGASDRPSLLIVDQVEELLSMVEDAQTRAAFAAAIVAPASSDNPQHRVIVIVREDFLDRLLSLEAFANRTEANVVEFRPKPMTSAELRLAIEAPAKAIGLKFDEGIVEDLVREVVNDPAALPMLQFTLTQLWRKRRRNRITREAYSDVGRPAEALGRTAEQLFEDLNTQQAKDAARDIFLALVVPSVGAEFVRLRVRRDLLHALRDSTQIDRVLDRFVAAGLIRQTPGADRADDRFDVMHEALLRNWQRLTGWLEEKRRVSARQLDVVNRARIWDQSGRERDHLAIGTAIAEAELFAGEDSLIREYFEASRHYAEKRTRQLRGAIATAVLVAASLLFMAVFVVQTYRWRAELNAGQVSLDDANSELNQLKEANTKAEDRLKRQIVTLRTQFEEVVAVGAPSVGPGQPRPSFSLRGPGESGFIWAGTDEDTLIADPRTLAAILPAQIVKGGLYRVRANLVLRAGLPSEPDFLPANPRFSGGTVAAGSLIVVIADPRRYDRRVVKQYWLQVRIVPRVIVQHPIGMEVNSTLERLRRAGYDAAAAEPIPAPESNSEVRYFYDQDQRPANGLIRALPRVLPPGQPEVRRVLRPQAGVRPAPGTLELWLGPPAPLLE